MSKSTRHSLGRFATLHALLGRRRLGSAGAGQPERRRRLQPRLEVLEDRCVPTVTLLPGAFAGLNHATGLGSEPPDTTTAVGPNNVVEMVNFAVAFYDKAGNLTGPGAAPNQVQPLSTFFAPAAPAGGALGAFLFDPVVTYDDISNRFVLSIMDSPGGSFANFLDVAISNNSNPANGFTFQRIAVQEMNGMTTLRADNQRIGWNADAWVISTKMDSGFGGTTVNVRSRLDVIYKSDLSLHSIDGPLASASILNFGITPATMHGAAANGPLWLVSSNQNGGSSLRAWQLTNVLNDATRTLTAEPDVGTNAYGAALNISDPGGVIDTNINDWIMNASLQGNTLVTCLNAGNGTVTQAHWYRINVSNAAMPALTNEGTIVQTPAPGVTAATFYPGIDIAPNGDLGMSFMESAAATMTYAGERISMYVTGLTSAENTNETPVLVQAGQANYLSTDNMGNPTGRQGDYSGITVDATPLTVKPAANQAAVEGASQSLNLGSFTDYEGNFWGGNEFANNAAGQRNWGTEIGQFSLRTKGPWSVDVDWGDSGPHDTFSVTTADGLGSRAHTYAEEGTKTVTVKVTDTSDNRSDSKTYTVTVSDPAVVATGVPVSAVEGAPFTGKLVATFTDPGGPELPVDGHYTATIAWGDLSSSAGTITYIDGLSKTLTVTGDHTYGEEGSYTVTTTINHEGIITVTTSTAHVSDPAVLATGVNVSAKECIAFSLTVATFTDPGGAEPNAFDPGPIPNHYTAITDWGDGTLPSADTITYSDGPGSKTAPFTVTGTHTFAEEGTHTIITTINHEGIITRVTSTATIRDNYGLLALDPSGHAALMVKGNGSVNVTNCGAVVVDSTDHEAIFLAGQATVAAAETDVAGGLVIHGQASLSGELNHEAATPDPLGLPLPPVPSLHFAAVHYSGSTPLTLLPGTYDGGIFIDGSGPVTLLSGVYYMNGGGFTVTGQGSVTGTSVLIVNAPTGPSDTISLHGQAVVSLTAPTGLTGALAPYNGIAIFQDPASSNPISVTGQVDPPAPATLTVTGTIYAPDALLMIAGNGNVVDSAFTAGQLSLGGEVIVFDAMITGNGDLTINADPAASPGGGAQAGHGPLPLLGGGQQPYGTSPSSAWVTRWDESTTGAHPTVLDQLFSSNSGGTVAALSGESTRVQPNRSMAPWLDPLSGQLVDELFSSLVQVA